MQRVIASSIVMRLSSTSSVAIRNGRRRGPLAHPRLQQPQLAALDGELDVAQVAVVRLEPSHRVPQRVVRDRVQHLQLRQRQGVADPRDDVLALRVRQVVAVDAGLPRRRVAREADARPRRLAEVAEHHAHHVHRGAQVVRDALAAPVQPRAVGVPRVEDRLDRHVELLARVLRELAAGLLDDDLLERLHEHAQVLRGQVDVGRGAHRGLALVQRRREQVPVDPEHGLAEHLDEPPVGVPGEPLVAGELGQPLHGRVVEPDVQDRLHHPGHRELRPGADRDQQRLVEVPEPPADRVLDLPDRERHLDPQLGRDVPVAHVRPARLGGDREPRRHRQVEVRHLREVGALAAQQVLLVLVTVDGTERRSSS